MEMRIDRRRVLIAVAKLKIRIKPRRIDAGIHVRESLRGACNSSGECECAPATTDICGAMECGTKPDGCGGMVTCPYMCPSGMECSGNACMDTTPACDPDDCNNLCIIVDRCCTAAGECGGDYTFGGCS